MPNRWPIASGNWSNPAIWSGSIIPTASDDVFANNQTVTVDQNISVQSLRTTSTTGVTQGGTFVSTDGISITTSLAEYGFIAAATAALTITGSHTVYISGSVRGSQVGNIGGIRTTTGGTAYITGSIIGGPGGNSSAPGIFSTLGYFYIQGNVTGGSNSGGSGVIFSNGILSINGNLFSTTAANAVTISTSSGSLYVTGSVIGNGTAGISFASTNILSISGSIISLTGIGISSTTAGTIIANGPIYSSPNTPGISSTSTSATVRVTGPLINQNNINAVYSPRIQWISSSATYYDIQSETFNQDVILYDPAYPITFPPTSSVRSGSLYGATNQLTGSMIVPSPSDVRYGVPVDNTTGSATLTPQDIFDFATQNLTGSNTIGARLQNISTVQTTAATIAAFKGR